MCENERLGDLLVRMCYYCALRIKQLGGRTLLRVSHGIFET